MGSHTCDSKPNYTLFDFEIACGGGNQRRNFVDFVEIKFAKIG